jgi:exodeoxyribonuclease V alpha subunit
VTAHISVRLFWHDNGWDGAICRDPVANVFCEAHEHVRDHKSPDEAREGARGKSPLEAGVYPGCEVSVQAFSRRRNEIRLWPPDWMTQQGVQPIEFTMDRFSSGMWPYADMWTEDRSHKSNEERRAIAEAFFEQIEEGKSLVFFYVDERNPLFIDAGERSPHRVLVGIARIKDYEKDIQEWNETTWGGEVNMVWSVPFRHAYPDDGIRLPVQAIEQSVRDPDVRAPYLVALDAGLRTDFRYGSSRITLDRAVAVVERAIGALAHVRADGVIDTSVDSELAWLNAVLLELWEDRGPYPGMAAVLSALGCPRSSEIAGRALGEVAGSGRDAAEVMIAALEGELDSALTPFADDIDDAAEEWSMLEPDEQDLARLLMRMELEPEQASAVLLSSETRVRHGLPAAAAGITANPYLLCECFTPVKDGDPIAFITVDHALVAHESMAPPGDLRVRNRDPRRLRALLIEVLWEQAGRGHTFVHARDALEGAVQRSPEDRPCDVALERFAHPKIAPTLDETLERFELDGEPYLALRDLREHERVVEERLDELAARPAHERREIAWQEIADDLADADEGEPVELSREQCLALDRSFHSPLSVISGAAGTGKSTLLAPLVAAITREEGAVPIRAVTPTGKAADRLKGLGVEAITMHRALAMADWYDRELGVWVESEGRVEANTIIVDECSMVDIELLATFFRAVDWQHVTRLVLVGDHHQLPPIGPGRPFFDVIAVMRLADEGDAAREPYRDRLSALSHNYRVDRGSFAIAFANSFAETAEPDDAIVWEAVARGRDLDDLRVRYWATQEELHQQLLAEIEVMVERECAELALEGSRAFNATIGHEDSAYAPSHWQILAPMRGGADGTLKLNALIQERYHGWAKRARRTDSGAYIRWPVKFGDEQITTFDKVMQISNETLPFRRPGVPWSKDDKHAVFNGQIGIVRGEWPRSTQRVRGPNERGNVEKIAIEFEGLPGLRFDYAKKGKRGIDRHLELAYATTVHKGQGSQFRHVFFVIPQAAAELFGRELTYTGLTRAQDTLTLFVERDIGALQRLRKRAAARTPQRNSRLFAAWLGTQSARGGEFGTTGGHRVASKSEVIIADLLERYAERGELSYTYEEALYAPGGDPHDFRLPDFTIHTRGRRFYWEHCGKMDDAAYREKWERVRLPWYKRHGFTDQLIVTVDGPEDPIDSGQLEREIIQTRILGG